MVLYIDGIGEAVGPYDPGFSFPGNFAIGARGADYGGSFYGSIDEVSVYNRALAADEIQAIYNAGAAGKCAAPKAPVILSQPRNTNTLVGGSVNFTVVAGGSQPLSYQWRFNGTNIAGATGTGLVLTNVQLAQAGVYSVLVTNALGSALSSNASLTVTLPTAVLRVGSVSVMGGRPISVPVTLTANGNENGLGFSLNFNAQRLGYVGAEPGSGAVGAALFVNSSQASTGRLGVVVAFPPHQTFTPGTQEVVRLLFSTALLTGVTPVTVTNSFGDQPVLRELYGTQLQSLPAFYSNGLVTLTPSVFEADVYPHPAGNQALTATDWAQAGRFAARLDLGTSGSEFQRADCAPRATLGDGQTGRYLSGLDPLSVVGGPSVETFVPASASPVARQLRIESTNALHGQTVRVTLQAQGDENAVGFSVSFDPDAFEFAGLSAGADTPGASFIANTNEAALGRVGVAVAWSSGLTFGAGVRELARLELKATENVAGFEPVRLMDQVVTRCAADVLADELPMDFLNGDVTVVPPNPNPTLGIGLSGSNVVLFWPRWAADFTLQTLAGGGGFGAGWSNVIVTLQTNGPVVSVALPPAEDARFFRLYRP